MPNLFSPSGIVTLTTDFGHRGPFVATMKGVMISRFAALKIIDLTHEIMVHWPAEAGFWLERAYRYFPEGTVHIAVVDPGVGTGRDIVCLVRDGHVFLAPDNGLLAPLAERPGQKAIFRWEEKRTRAFLPRRLSATFHGRDIFAPIAAALAKAELKPEDIGPPITELVPSLVDEPTAHAHEVQGVVITEDHFGNLITNIREELLAPGRNVAIIAGGHQFPLCRTYGDVEPGAFLALINSFGVVEIAKAEQNAARALGIQRGAPVTARYL